MEKFLKITLIFILALVCLLPGQGRAVSSLSDFSFQIQPQTSSSLATWTISFGLPQDSLIGHILISLAGYSPDLSQARLTVSGLPQGVAIIGKSNPNCVSNCDDIRYYWPEPVSVSKREKIAITLANVKNSDVAGQTGINFISLFSSKYPQTDLAFNASDYLIQLSPPEKYEELMPETLTNEGQNPIQEVLINELFYQQDSKTTKLNEIRDASRVENFTLDLLGKVKVVFKEPIDLSGEEAVHFIANLADYMTFNYLYFWVDYQLMNFFKAPLELTFYDLPYVWEPDILKDDLFILEKIENLNLAIVDDQPRLSFIIREGGFYRIVPNLKLYIPENQERVKFENRTKMI
ncbi:MAG TPA: hypothetical protein ENN28_03235 [Candidatus Uhrbacteria bacterium]|nr:hypothetical protein [Candidatus Uhrbacteria bacterium]